MQNREKIEKVQVKIKASGIPTIKEVLEEHLTEEQKDGYVLFNNQMELTDKVNEIIDRLNELPQPEKKEEVKESIRRKELFEYLKFLESLLYSPRADLDKYSWIRLGHRISALRKYLGIPGEALGLVGYGDGNLDNEFKNFKL